MDINKIKKVHFIGIGGIGVSAAAKLMLEIGKVVTGSDTCDSEIVDEVRKKGAAIFIGSDKKRIKKDIDLVVYSPAVPDNNPERAEARRLGISQSSYPEFLGILSRKTWTVAISGTNGKSTTTSMLSLILEKAGLDPTVIVGSKVKGFKDGNLRLNTNLRELESEVTRNKKPLKDNLFVVEGCEYKASMLKLNPKMIVLTNIEEDHLDYYKNLAHIKKTFREYIKKVEKGGVLVYNADDFSTVEVVKKYKGMKVGYGIRLEKSRNREIEKLYSKKQENKKTRKQDFVARNIRIKNQRQIFEVWNNYEKLGEIRLKIPGIFNIYNALAAISAAFSLGVDFKVIQKTLGEFNGIWRRFEIIGKYKGAIIISDYAHHPTAIKKTIKAAREFYPTRRLVVAFQPHSRNRTKNLFTEFIGSFNEADLVILSEIYDVAGRENPKENISSRELASAVNKRRIEEFKSSSAPLKKAGKDDDVFYAKDLKECKKILLKNIKKDDAVILMGAGDIYKISLKNRK